MLMTMTKDEMAVVDAIVAAVSYKTPDGKELTAVATVRQADRILVVARVGQSRSNRFLILENGRPYFRYPLTALSTVASVLRDGWSGAVVAATADGGQRVERLLRQGMKRAAGASRAAG